VDLGGFAPSKFSTWRFRSTSAAVPETSPTADPKWFARSNNRTRRKYRLKGVAVNDCLSAQLPDNDTRDGQAVLSQVKSDVVNAAVGLTTAKPSA
jgi:hypothetical protein